MEPETCAPSGNKPIRASAVRLLPLPDSPTRPNVPPAANVKLTSRNTGNGPAAVASITFSASVLRRAMSAPAQTWIEQIAQAIPQQIQAQHRQSNGETWINRQLRGLKHQGLRLAQHPPP